MYNIVFIHWEKFGTKKSSSQFSTQMLCNFLSISSLSPKQNQNLSIMILIHELLKFGIVPQTKEDKKIEKQLKNFIKK